MSSLFFGSTLTDAEVNGIISVFCHYYEHHETFDYSDENIELDTCDLEVLNSIYSDEELIVETPLQVKITDERFNNQNYYLGLMYYSYLPDQDNEPPVLEKKFFPLVLDEDNIGEIDFDGADVVYVMLTDWVLVTKFDKPMINE